MLHFTLLSAQVFFSRLLLGKLAYLVCVHGHEVTHTNTLLLTCGPRELATQRRADMSRIAKSRSEPPPNMASKEL